VLMHRCDGPGDQARHRQRRLHGLRRSFGMRSRLPLRHMPRLDRSPAQRAEGRPEQRRHGCL